jgi:hypothetical protein
VTTGKPAEEKVIKLQKKIGIKVRVWVQPKKEARKTERCIQVCENE